jgi:hypothetical protein
MLVAGSAEDFLLKLAEAAFVAAVSEFGFDRVHLLMHAGDIGFQFDPQFGDVRSNGGEPFLDELPEVAKGRFLGDLRPFLPPLRGRAQG